MAPRRRQRFWLEAALVATLGVAVLGSTIAITRRDDLAFIDPIIDIKHLIDTRYVKEADSIELRNGAIRGMLEVLGDPHTQYVPGELRSEFEKELTGEYAGIGAQITIRDGWLTIVSPLDDSPAYEAGLMADDRIVEIEGESTAGISADEAVVKLTGKAGTEVTFTVERDGRRFDVTLERRHIKTRSARGLHREGDGGQEWAYLLDPRRRIGYLRLTQFTPGAGDEVAAALRAMGADQGRLGGLVFDLRWNPGGVLEEAIEIADMFLDEGVIVSTNGRAHKEQVARASRKGTLGEFPIVVLLNDTSASASEVLAGALVENDRAIALGVRTFGKGSVQSVMNIASAGDGSQLKITEQLYYLPSGRSIHRLDDSVEWGVDPSPGFYVPLEDREEIELFNARHELEIIRAPAGNGEVGGEEADRQAGAGGEGGLNGAPPAEQRWHDPRWIERTAKDRQLAAALEALQLRVDGGEWAPTGEEGIEGGRIAFAELSQTRRTRERLIREIQRIDRRIDALERAAPDADRAGEAFDLWADDLDLTGGRVVVRDAEGNVVSELRITGNRLERWLMDADVEKIAEEAQEGAAEAAGAG